MQLIQCIITIFTLFAIATYANPVEIAEVPREVATYCGGYGTLTCNVYCIQQGKTEGTCGDTYVKGLTIQAQYADLLTSIQLQPMFVCKFPEPSPISL